MNEKSIFLVFTPIDRHYKDADTHYSPPLGLVALQNYLAKALPNVKVTILDGSVCYSTAEIVNRIEEEKPDYVGQSIQLISYENSLEIAAAAKAVGAITILGGHQATQLRKEIATARMALIDFIVYGDGERALVGLLSGQDINTIPNLAYCRDGVYFENHFCNAPLSEMPAIDYAGIDLEPYRNLLAASPFNISSCTTFLRTYSHKGCGNRGGSGACVFCGRADVSVRFKTPHHYWTDIKTVVDRNGADYVFDVGDDLLASLGWLRKVVACKPSMSRGYEMGIFGRANRVTSEKARLIKALNVKDVVIGFETGDPFVMAQVGKKGTTVDVSVQAAEHLFQQDIDVCASFVLGLPGESERSLASTIKVAYDIIELSKKHRGVKPREMVANLLEPSPGSPSFKEIVRTYPEKYAGKDFLDLEDLQYDYFRVFLNVSSLSEYEKLRSQLKEAADAIHASVDFADSQGWLQGEVNQELTYT